MIRNASLRAIGRVAGLCVALSIVPAFAQTFPTRPVTLVSPFLAGNTSDTIARAIAEVASKELGQPIIVEPKPGAEALIGIMDVNKAPADGYRVLWAGGGSLMGIPAMRKNPPFDPVTGFTPIAGSVDFSFFLYVNPSFPAKTMKEFIAYVKANPGKVDYATGNLQGRMIMSDVARKHGLNMTQVQYKGELGAAADLLTNRVQAMFATSSVMNFVKEGKLRVLATTLPARSPLLPDVPSMREEGVAGGEFGGGWLGIFGPAGLPKPVTARLNKAFVAAFNDPTVQTRMRDAGLVYTPVTTPEALARFVKDERETYRRTAIDLDMVQD